MEIEEDWEWLASEGCLFSKPLILAFKPRSQGRMTELVQTHTLLKEQINWSQEDSDVGRVTNEKQFCCVYRPAGFYWHLLLFGCVYLFIFAYPFVSL